MNFLKDMHEGTIKMKIRNTFPLVVSAILSLSSVAMDREFSSQHSNHGSVNTLKERFEHKSLSGPPQLSSPGIQSTNDNHTRSTLAAKGSPVSNNATRPLHPPVVTVSAHASSSPPALLKTAPNKPLVVPVAKVALPPHPELHVQRHSEDPKNPDGLYQKGMRYKELEGAENDTQFVKYIGLAAEKKHPGALFEMGLLWYSGERGVKQDILEAARLWRMAGDNVGALFYLAQLTEVGYPSIPRSENEAVNLYEKAMGKQFRSACISINMPDSVGEEDPYWSLYRIEAARKAAEYKVNSGASWVIDDGWRLYRALCAVGDNESLYLLGSAATESPIGRSKEEILRGLNQLEQAAAQDYAPALHLLGNHYKFGIYQVLEMDLVKARKNYQKAADLKYVDAINDLQAFDVNYPHVAKSGYY
jgi:TPR repeat protein